MNAPHHPRPALTVVPLADAAAWDAFVAAAPNATPFHSRAWSEAVRAATGHRAHVLAAYDGAGAITGILPLHHVRSPLFGQALVGSAFGVGGGILADEDLTAFALAHAAVGLASQMGVPTVELRGGVHPSAPCWAVEEGIYAGFARNLASDDAAELLAIPRKQRAEVRKALDSDLTAIAALTTTAFGRGLLDDADATAGRASLGVVIGTNVQAWDADLDEVAALATTAYGRGFLDRADAAAARAYIGQGAGTDLTADLEEETHASEHADGAADEVALDASQVTTGVLVAARGGGGAALPTCAGTDKLTANGTQWSCATDQTGGGGGAGYADIVAAVMAGF